MNIVRFAKATEAAPSGIRHVLILDLDLPQPTRSGGHGRLLEIATLMRDSGVAVTIATCNSLERTAVAWGVPVSSLRAEADSLKHRFPLVVGPLEIGAYLNEKGMRLSAVWFSRSGPGVAFLHHVLAAAPYARIVFDSMDAEHVRTSRRQKMGDLAEVPGEFLDSLRREKLMVQAADTVIAVTEGDAAALAELAEGSPPVVAVIPYLHDVDVRKRHGDRTAAQWDALFVGGFLHEPNTDAVRWLLESIVPQLPANRYRIAVVGHGLPQDLARRADQLGVAYLGEVRSLDGIYETTKVSIAPVRFGAGVKGKVVEAGLHGLPVIGTDVAWEGIDVSPGVSGMVANDAGQFASAIEQLVDDNGKRTAIVEASGNWLRSFASESYAGVVDEAIGAFQDA